MKNCFTVIWLCLLIATAFSCKPGCDSCDATEAVCYKCKDPTLSKFDGGSCDKVTLPVDYCSLYQVDGICKACSIGRVLADTHCAQDISGCIKYSPDQKSCLTCGFGKTLKDGACIGVLNCGKPSATDPTQCDECAANFYAFEPTMCFADSCSMTDNEHGQCSECEAANFLNGFECVPISFKQKLNMGCAILSKNGQCRYCEEGFTLDKGACSLSKPADKKPSTPTSPQIPPKGKPTTITPAPTLTPIAVPPADTTTTTPTPVVAPNPTKPAAPPAKPPTTPAPVAQPQTTSQVITIPVTVFPPIVLTPPPSTTAKAGCIDPSDDGKCSSCDSGYSFTDGACTLVPNADKNCLKYLDMRCVVCDGGLALSSDGFCKDVNCVSLGPNPCTACNQGFYPDGAACLPIPVPNCVDFAAGACKKCEDRYWLSGKNCLQVDSSCKQFNPATGKCITCTAANLVVVNGACVKPTPPPTPTTPVKPPTTTTTTTPTSTTNTANPVKPPTTSTPPTTTPTTGTKSTEVLSDLNCKTFQNGVCVKCSSGFVKKDGKCVAVSPLCKTFDPDNGNCLSCYSGYRLADVACITDTPSKATVNCKKFVNNSCQECSKGYFVKDGGCVAISPLCATSNQTNGFCQTCFPGYVLNPTTGTCAVSKSDPNCKVIKDGVCQECSANFLKINGKCIAQNPLCKTLDKNTGSCQTCYPGFLLLQGNCYSAGSVDMNCAKRQGNTCLECNARFYMNQQTRKCTAVSATCKDFDPNNGQCLTCANSFMLLQNGECIVRKSTDPYCAKSDANGNCATCMPRFYLDASTYSCKAVSLLCDQFDYRKNICTKCNTGYFLQDNDCIYPAMGFDEHCTHYEGSYCSTCEPNFYLFNYVCTAVDANCIHFNYDASICEACAEGQPVGPDCIV